MEPRHHDLSILGVAMENPQLGQRTRRLAPSAGPLSQLGISDLIAEPEEPSFISRTVAQRRVDRRYS
jgi:hypothetical protein